MSDLWDYIILRSSSTDYGLLVGVYWQSLIMDAKRQHRIATSRGFKVILDGFLQIMRAVFLMLSQNRCLTTLQQFFQLRSTFERFAPFFRSSFHFLLDRILIIIS